MAINSVLQIVVEWLACTAAMYVCMVGRVLDRSMIC